MQAAAGPRLANQRFWRWSSPVLAIVLWDLVQLCNGGGAIADEKHKTRNHCKVKHDPHGTWEGSRDLGGDYTLFCKDGYAVDGKPNTTIKCSHEGLWDADPWCENNDDCTQLQHMCGPGGLCVDHVGYAECLCEEGATKRLAANGEEVCYFKGAAKNERCGNYSCGSHGICVDLAQYQGTFDTGSTAFRCSCQEGYYDNGETCVPVNCGERHDELGSWTGSTSYGGEYTLTCYSGAFIWGGSEAAITISCPKKGDWPNKIRCLQRESKDAEFDTFRFWINVMLSLLCICTAALAAGLTMGLVSQEKLELYMVLQEARSGEGAGQGEQQENARQLLDIKRDHHQLLVTLLLLNAFANEALPIFLDELVTAQCAVLLSVTLVLLFGEILPSAIMTSQVKMDIVTPLIPLVKILMLVFYPISRPIAMLLDWVLGEEEEDMYTRAELRAVLRMHCGQVEEGALPATTLPMVGDESSAGHRELWDLCADDSTLDGNGRQRREEPPLKTLEGDLFARVMDMGETKVVESNGFRPISGRGKKCCATDFMAAEETAYALQTAVDAIAAGREGIVIFKSRDELEDWPNSVQVNSIMAVVRVMDLLTEDSKTKLKDLRLRKCVDVNKVATLTDAFCALGDNCNPSGFAIVTEVGEFVGLLDGQEALLGLTPGFNPLLSDSLSNSFKRGGRGDTSQQMMAEKTAMTVAKALELSLPVPKGVVRPAETGHQRQPALLRHKTAPAEAPLNRMSPVEEETVELPVRHTSASAEVRDAGLPTALPTVAETEAAAERESLSGATELAGIAETEAVDKPPAASSTPTVDAGLATSEPTAADAKSPESQKTLLEPLETSAVSSAASASVGMSSAEVLNVREAADGLPVSAADPEVEGSALAASVAAAAPVTDTVDVQAETSVEALAESEPQPAGEGIVEEW